MRERSVIDGQITFEEIKWKQNIGRMTPKKKELLELREKQFLKIEKVRSEMMSEGDGRPLFLIKRGTVISSEEKHLFRGNLSQDVLAMEEEGFLNLKPLIPEDNIIINYFDPIVGERVRGPIRDYRIQKEGVECLDLIKIRSEEELFKSLSH